MAPADARAPRRRGARGLACGPQRGLSARRIDCRRAPRGGGRIISDYGKITQYRVVRGRRSTGLLRYGSPSREANIGTTGDPAISRSNRSIRAVRLDEVSSSLKSEDCNILSPDCNTKKRGRTAVRICKGVRGLPIGTKVFSTCLLEN